MTVAGIPGGAGRVAEKLSAAQQAALQAAAAGVLWRYELGGKRVQMYAPYRTDQAHVSKSTVDALASRGLLELAALEVRHKRQWVATRAGHAAIDGTRR